MEHCGYRTRNVYQRHLLSRGKYRFILKELLDELTSLPVMANVVENKGKCRLCGNDGLELQRSHILPAFAFRWMKKSSATGHIRNGEEPNRRVQDGLKERWLCSPCENDIGKAEMRFAEQFFHPVVKDRSPCDEYGPWLLKFCVSVTWRVLLKFRDMDPFDDYSSKEYDLLERAAAVWREYLRGSRSDVETFRQHLYIVQRISSAQRNFPPNINRHVLRHISADVVRGADQHIVFAKLPRFFIMGVLRDDRPDDWVGTEVFSDTGVVPTYQRAPDGFYNYLYEKAGRSAELLASISDRQKMKVLNAIEAHPNRVDASDTVKALNLDIALRAQRNPEES